MAANTPLANSIAWAHFQLRGGWKNLLLTTVGYALIIGACLVVTIQVNPRQATNTCSVWTGVLLGLQTGILVLLGAVTVNSALRTDLNARMIESHRLMPVSSGSAIFGYLLGGCSQVLCLAAATFILGLITNLGAHTPPAMWVFPNLVLGSFAVFFWITSLFVGFLTHHGGTWIFSLSFLIFASQGILLHLLPAVSVLISPLVGHTIFSRRAVSIETHWPYLVSAAAQLVFGAIFYTAAARRFRRPEAPALGVWLGLVLLAAWVATSGVAISWYREFTPRGWAPDDFGGATPVISSLALAMLLGLIPIASAGRADAHWRRACHVDPATPRRPIHPLLIVVAASTIALLLIAVAPFNQHNVWQICLRAGVCVLAFCIACCYLLRIVFRVNGRGIIIVGLFVVLGWVGPFIIDLIRHSMMDRPNDDVLTRVSTCSPLGLLMQLWDRRPLNTTLGLIVQCAFAVIAAILYHMPRRLVRKPLSEPPKAL